MKKQTILFDLDDTLIHCNKYFFLVIEQFTDLMQTWFASYGISKQRFIDKQQKLDLLGVDEYGFVADRFPLSLIETYEYYSDMTGRKKSEQEQEQLRKLGFSVYGYPTEPYPSMAETLEALRRQGHLLCLYTGGDHEIQHSKVKQIGLSAYFDERIFVSLRKTTTAMEELLMKQGFDRANTWMIGNSVTTDVLPALEAGIHTIYIPAEDDWLYNVGEVNVTPKGAYFELASLKDVPATISSYVTGN